MKIRGVLLGTLDEQIAGGDQYPIDPAKVKLPPESVPISIGFQSDQRVGRTTNVWLEDGRILFEANIEESMLPRTDDEQYFHSTAAIGISSLGNEVREGKAIITRARLFEVGLTDKNENHNQPEWEAID